MNSIIGIAVIVKLHEAISIFDYDLPETAIALEKSFKVPFPSVAGNISNIDSSSRRHL